MKGKRVILTGAFGVLGRSVAELLGDRGARIAAVDLSKAATPSMADDVLVLAGFDLADPADAARAVATAADAFDGVDVLINVAGGFAWETLADGAAETWDRLYRMNVATCANMCRAAVPYLVRSDGRVVNVGAGGAVKAAAGMGAYATAKGGVHRLTEALAEELKGKVAVNAVLPSIIDTPLNRRDMPKANFAAWVSPRDLAEVIVFLASEKARAMTGALVPVTGAV